MAMEINVLFHGALPTKAALACALKELGFPLSIVDLDGSLDEQRGFLPMRLKREQTGVEFDVFNSRADVEDIAGGREIDPAFDRSANFRWGGDESEMLCALCASAALAQIVGGVVLGEDDETPLTAEQAIAAARQSLQPRAKTPRVGGTTPADIKRYLKPLLERRRDLVLMGRMLLIRPVRHLLRGALLERSDQHTLRIYWYVQPLYDPGPGSGYGDRLLGGWLHVWQPHFEPLLMNILDEDVFSRVGPMVTLSHFADALAESIWNMTPPVKALVLAGAHERAETYVRELERTDPDRWKRWAEEQRAFLARDIAGICAEAHAREAKTVQAMKLESIWEASPFAVEVSAHERASRTSEPSFSTSPWIERPEWLLQDLPNRPGEVRFAKEILYREGNNVLLVPLSREAAEARHRNGEPYAFAARLQDERLVTLRHFRRDPCDPVRVGPGASSSDGGLIEIAGSARVLVVNFDSESRTTVALGSFHVLERGTTRSLWNSVVNRWAGEISVHDGHRSREMPLTDVERELLTCAIPAFGEFEELKDRALAWLRIAGFGELI